MSHPFGNLLSQYLARKHGLSQSKLAAGVDQDPAVIAHMCKGRRLTGPSARGRIVSIIRWLQEQGVLSSLEEANALLGAAGFVGLTMDQPGEPALRDLLHTQLQSVQYDDEDQFRRQVAKLYREREFAGIPRLKERQTLMIEDIFVGLRVEHEVDAQTQRPRLAAHCGTGADATAASQQLRDKRSSRVHSSPPESQVTIEEILRETSYVALLGDPGTGKSTLLRFLMVLCAEDRAEKEIALQIASGLKPLPIFVALGAFALEAEAHGTNYNLFDYLYMYANKHLMLNLQRGFFEEALTTGRCLVCLDGLDEVAPLGQRKLVTDVISALVSRYPRNHYLVTSRIAGYDEAPLRRTDFTHYTILPLTDEDIRLFVQKWYAYREPDLGLRKQHTSDLLSTIERQPQIQTLARNPLLLTIIALVHRVEATLPYERVKLYDKCVTALVETWDEAKKLSLDEKGQPFFEYRRRLLERLAYELHSSKQSGEVQWVKVGDLERILTRFLTENRRLGFTDDPDGARAAARNYIRLARERIGLLVEVGDGVFSFPHPTFQEYLAACDIEHRLIARGINAVWEAIADHLLDPRWQEVILLLLGSLSKYDEVPTELIAHILEAGMRDKLEDGLHRHLMLCARALADGVDVAIEVRRRIVDELLGIARLKQQVGQNQAFTALAALEGDRYAVAGLLGLAQDAQLSSWARSRAAQALGKLGRADVAVPLLLEMAQDTQLDAAVRTTAAQALGELGQMDTAVPLLLEMAQDTQLDAAVRTTAAQALGELGQMDTAVPLLLEVVRNSQAGLVKRP